MPLIRPRRLHNITIGAATILGVALSPPAFAQALQPPVLHDPRHGSRTVHHQPPLHPHVTPHPAHPPRHVSLPPPKPVPAPVAAPAAPVVPPPPPKGTNTGLPLPRFAALRADAVNMRSGPGTRYPIQWVYKRRDLPVRIEREFDVWRLVEDSDGVKGWVQGATLVGTRSFVILPQGGQPDATGSVNQAADPAPGLPAAIPPGSQMLRASAQPDAPVVAILRPGVVGRLRACPAGSGWCRVSIRDYAGWLPRNALWGLLPDEAIQPP